MGSTHSRWVQPNFVHAFVASFSVIVISEIGDKTFFIAAIMAMRYAWRVCACVSVRVPFRCPHSAAVLSPTSPTSPTSLTKE